MWHSSLIPSSEVLTINSGLPDILWCFSHFRDERRLTLSQSPHFYEGPFPATFGPASETRPTEDYRGTIYVLTSNERQVFFQLGRQEENRIFVSLWRTDDNTLILKGSCAAFFFFHQLTFFQTSSEILRVKTSSNNLSLTFPSAGLPRSFPGRPLPGYLRTVSPSVRPRRASRAMSPPWTGEFQFTICGIPHLPIYI